MNQGPTHTILFHGLLLLIASSSAAHHVSAQELAKKPNVLLILADDMGFSDLGCYGSEIPTPHLDRLAKNGLQFTQFYNAARCCPTRAALMSGLYPHQAGIGWMIRDDNLPGYRGSLSPQATTIAERLSSVGYRTYHVGKWHLTGKMRSANENWPLQRGFDMAYGTAGGGSYFHPTTLYRDNDRIQPPKNGYHITDAFSQAATECLKGHQQQSPNDPFFMYLAYTAPHFPLHAWPEDIARHVGKYREGWDQLRFARHRKQQQLGIGVEFLSPRDPAAKAWNSLSEDEQIEWDLRMAVYAAMIEQMDRGIGEVIRLLERQGTLDNTLILFLSDNGSSAEFIDRGDTPGSKTGTPESFRCLEVGWSNAANTPFREHKMWTHEGGISTPFIMHWPDGIETPGRMVRDIGHVIDIMPTLLEISGATYPESIADRTLKPLPGRSFAPLLSGKAVPTRGPLFWEHQGNRAMRDGNWKLVATHDSEWELYDLSTDRCETRNIEQQNTERVQQMITDWQAWSKRVGVVDWDSLPRPAYKQNGKPPYRMK